MRHIEEDDSPEKLGLEAGFILDVQQVPTIDDKRCEHYDRETSYTEGIDKGRDDRFARHDRGLDWRAPSPILTRLKIAHSEEGYTAAFAAIIALGRQHVRPGRVF